jgi:DNA ligase (NAD+)
MQRLADASEEQILAVRGIGEAIARSVARWFDDPHAVDLVGRLAAHGLNMTEPKASTGSALAGQTWVITGTLPGHSREQATQLIEENGGRVTSSVSKKTTAVLYGEDAGSKLTKARELGVECVTIDELLKRIEK